MNPSINSLLGPLEAATRQGSWEDVEDIAKEISRLARLQRLSGLQKIQKAIRDKEQPKAAPGGSQGAKTPTPDHFTETQRSVASELLEKLKDPAWAAKLKAGGWDTGELRKAIIKALPVAPFMGTRD